MFWKHSITPNSYVHKVDTLKVPKRLAIFFMKVKVATKNWVRNQTTPGPIFTKRKDVLPQDFVKSRRRDI